MRAFPNKRYESLWHQDAGYLGAGLGRSEPSDEAYSRLRYINCCTPFQPVNRHNGCMQVIPGTHKLGVAKHVYVPPYDYLHIDFDLITPMIDAGKVADIEINPGDMLIFQNLLFHQGGLTTRANFDGMPIFVIRMPASRRFRVSTVTLYGVVNILKR